jgi:hypothetical protein
MPVESPYRSWGFAQSGDRRTGYDMVPANPEIMAQLDSLVVDLRREGGLIYKYACSSQDRDIRQIIHRAGNMLPLVFVYSRKSPNVRLSVNLPKEESSASTVTIESDNLYKTEEKKVRIIAVDGSILGLSRKAKNNHNYERLKDKEATGKHVLKLLVGMFQADDLVAEVGFFIPTGYARPRPATEWRSIGTFGIQHSTNNKQ